MSAPIIPTREQFRERGPQWEAGWIAGCHAEAASRNEGMSKAARDVRALLEAFARHPGWADASKLELIALLFHIEAAALPWWRRGWLVLRGPR
jgi:hypothetical protein